MRRGKSRFRAERSATYSSRSSRRGRGSAFALGMGIIIYENPSPSTAAPAAPVRETAFRKRKDVRGCPRRLLRGAFKGQQDSSPQSLKGEQDAESLGITVGANLVDVAAKMSCLTQATARNRPHLLDYRCSVCVTQRVEEVTDGTSSCATLVEAPASARRHFHRSPTVCLGADPNGIRRHLRDDRLKKVVSLGEYFDHCPISGHVSAGQ